MAVTIQLPNSPERRDIGGIAILNVSDRVELDEYYYQVAQVLISADRLQYLNEAWDSRHQITVDASGNVTGVTGTLEDIVIPKEALTIPNSTSTTSPFYPHRKSAKSLTLPSNLQLIGIYAFQDCSGFTGSLIIPNSVTSISDSAFQGCSGFTGSLTISNSVTSIGTRAFMSCGGFTGSLTIPNSVTSIGTYAFQSCSGFTGAVFDGQAPTLSAGAFFGCTAILEYDFTNCTTVPSLSSTSAFQSINANCIIKVPAALEAEWKAATNWATYADYISGGGGVEPDEYYYQVAQVLISADRLQYLLKAWESRNQITIDASGNVTGVTGTPNDIVIPKEAVTIPDANFATSPFYPHRESAKSLTLPSNLSLIGDYAFYLCGELTGSLTIPNSVTSIGTYAFAFCGDFTGSLTIPNSVTSIGNYAFQYCSGFTGSLIIPDSVTSIGEAVFSDCSGFTGSLTIPNSVTIIGNYAFSDCSGFTGSLTIPNSVTSIGEYAFQECYGFTGSLTIPNSVTSIGEYAFQKCYCFTGSLTIPNSVIIIDYSTFGFCYRLTNVVFDGQIQEIRSGAFDCCYEILEYDFTNCTTVPSLGNVNAFTGINANCQIKVPLALEAAWKSATNWATYASKIIGV